VSAAASSDLATTPPPAVLSVRGGPRRGARRGARRVYPPVAGRPGSGRRRYATVTLAHGSRRYAGRVPS